MTSQLVPLFLAVPLHVIELRFHRLADESGRRFFKSAPRPIARPSKTVDRLRQMAARELADNAEFRRLPRNLSGAPGQANSSAHPSLATAK